MFASLLLAAIAHGPGSSCAGGAATIEAFVGPKSAESHVRKIEKIVPMEQSYQGYAIAFRLTASDGHQYLSFPQYGKLSPDMIGSLSFILGRKFTSLDAASVLNETAPMKKRIDGPTFKTSICAE